MSLGSRIIKLEVKRKPAKATRSSDELLALGDARLQHLTSFIASVDCPNCTDCKGDKAQCVDLLNNAKERAEKVSEYLKVIREH